MKIIATLSLYALPVFFVVAASGCDPVSEPASSQPAERQAAEQPEPAKAPAKNTDEDGHDHDHENDPPTNDGPLTARAAVGGEVADSVELVDAAAVVANPEQFAGRTVRIRGQVKGFCHHRRAWFAIDVPEGTPPYLRIITGPTFLVPPGIMNATATAVGTIEAQQIPGSRLAHYEREHELGTGGAQGRQTRAIMRATGAVFEPAAAAAPAANEATPTANEAAPAAAAE